MASTKSTREAERNRKRKYWRRHLQAWRDSGLPQTKYCRVKKLNIKTFGYWKRKLGKEIPAAKLVQLPVQQLIKSEPPRQIQAPSGGLTLIHNESIRIEIAEDFSAGALKNLIQVLDELC